MYLFLFLSTVFLGLYLYNSNTVKDMITKRNVNFAEKPELINNVKSKLINKFANNGTTTSITERTS